MKGEAMPSGPKTVRVLIIGAAVVSVVLNVLLFRALSKVLGCGEIAQVATGAAVEEVLSDSRAGDGGSRGMDRSTARDGSDREAAIPAAAGASQPTPEQQRRIEQLESIGYLAGSRPATDKKSVTRFVPGQAWDGLNFYVSGHDAGATLIDMQGRELHGWHCEAARAWPDREWGRTAKKRGEVYDFWRRAHVFPNGDVLAIFTGVGLVKLDRDSSILWAQEGGFHHDLHVAADGRIYALTREAKLLPRINEQAPILEDMVAILDAAGNELERFSVLEALEASPYRSLLWHNDREGDFLHTNTIELLDGRLAGLDPRFRAGNLLISIVGLDAVCVIGGESERVEWASSSLWSYQHQPTVIDSSHMIIFDNHGNFGNSRVLEFQPLTQESEWIFAGTPEDPICSGSGGSCQRLPNGNTLITESDAGRALEVTRGGTVVWEFHVPYEVELQEAKAPTLFEVIRLAPDFGADWLEGS
ncbi:MAG: hypothetical protein GF330_01965 [Candidatus Eisenbacteria bacterium]|nr:hypothetical protein [Candidatus Eisenbacteria bacterium]